MDLFEYFKTQFKPGEIDKAKNWYIKWRDEWKQEIPGYNEFSGDNIFSFRTMAGHLSWYLQGKEGSYQDVVGPYRNTKYGTELYYTLHQ